MLTIDDTINKVDTKNSLNNNVASNELEVTITPFKGEFVSVPQALNYWA